MKTITDHLAGYAAYHRDRRNIITHLVGIPMIVIAIEILLSRPTWTLFEMSWSPAVIISAVAALFYLKLDLVLGIIMTALLAGAVWLGSHIALLDTTLWLSWGVGLFVGGWILQFIGHYYEGRKPAFVDDIMGLAIGPLFVVAEVVFMLGAKQKLYRDIEERFK